MLRPERMSRAVIAGPRDKLPECIEVLHELKLIHIIDHHGEDDTFRIGKPLSPAAELSDNLVKLRSIASILAIKAPPKEKERIRIEELRQKVLSLELNISGEDAARKKAEGLLGDLERRIDELRPFASIGLPLEAYRGYESLTVIVGRVARDVTGFDEAMPVAEVFRGPGFVAVFVPKASSEQALALLGPSGFTQVDIPAGEGRPQALLDAAVADRDKWKARLVEVDKAEAPLRFAVSDHSFVIDGWVPSSGFKALQTRMESLGIYVESGESSEAHEEEAPPVLLRNPKPAKPFEFLIHLYSTPSYHELDPTLFLFIAAPFFFGFMIGDVGYGALFVALGVIAAIRLDPKSIWWRILFVTAVGGVWSVLFGLFVFGEAFGLPFHSPPAHLEELSWESFGLFVPIPTLIHKAFGIGDMIYLSILFAELHLGTGYIIGFVNEVHHNKRHAVAKLGWFMCLFGLFTLLTFNLRWNPIAGWVWNVPLGWFPRMIEPLGLRGFLGVPIPFASLILILGALLGLLESVIAPIEVASLLANIMSYMRLAGIGIGKAAIASAFNVILLQNLILTGQIGFIIMGVAFLILAQMLVFLLGWISAGIQALRLNYMEAFIKFYKGNGTPFRPFGVRGTQEV